MDDNNPASHEYDLIAYAYVNLLRLPHGSLRRHTLQGALVALREELISIERKGAEHVQTHFERAAEIIESQESLGRALEKVLFDNLWELYARD